MFFYQIMYKGQTITKLAENGRKGFRAFCVVVSEVGYGREKRSGIKKEARNKIAEKGPKNIRALCAIY